MKLSLLAFAFILFLPLTSQADILISMSDIPASSEDSVNPDQKKAPGNYKKEAKEFGEICREDEEIHLYFECGCLANDYLQKRKEMGPEASPTAIRNQLGANCKDGSGIALKLEERCVQDRANAPKGRDIKEFCECYGTSFGRFFEETEGIMHSATKLKLMSMARLKCEDPKTYKKLYGQR